MDIMPIVAAEGVGGTISDAIADISTLFTSATNMITGSPIAMAFVGMALVGGAIGLFGSVIRVGRRR